MRFLAAVLAVPALLIGWQLWSDHSFEQRLQPIAAGISGRHVHGRTARASGAGSSTPRGAKARCASTRPGVPGAEAVPHPADLPAAADVRRSRATTASSTASRRSTGRAAEPLPFDSECYARARTTIYAVLVLAHESYHTAGVTDEAAANCFAIQAMAWTAMQLGSGRRRGRAARARDGGARAEAGRRVRDDRVSRRREARSPPGDPRFPTEHPIAPPLGHGGMPSLVGRA